MIFHKRPIEIDYKISDTSYAQKITYQHKEDIDNMSEAKQQTCASCGKEGNSDNMNICNRCKMVTYCNAACKKKHRSKHKKKCDRQVAELYDEKLFKEVEPEECPLCLLPLPIDIGQSAFHSCCGKTVCNGCIYEMAMSGGGKDLCPFCRTPPASSDEESIQRVKKLMEKGNTKAFYTLGGCYETGFGGLLQDYQKAHKLYLKAGELGCAEAYYNLACLYSNGMGVEVDKNKAKYYYELAAMNGHIFARHNLGCVEWEKGNRYRAMKHFVMAARAGDEGSLDKVKQGFKNGMITKDGYAIILRAYHQRQKEMRSDARDEVQRRLSGD